MGLEFNAWSFLRDVLHRGTAIERHCEAKGHGYETLSAKLDAAAREFADKLKPHLAAVPADDGEPVTADWLRTVGFVPDPTDDYMVRLRLPTETGYPAFLVMAADPQCELNGAEVAFSTFEGEDSDADSEQFAVVSGRNVLTTRGHVRRLCAALGIPLTEPAT